MAGSHFPTKPREPPPHRFGYQRVVHYSSLIDPQPGDSDYFGLVFPDLFWSKASESNAVSAASIFQSREARQFFFANRYDQLSTPSMRNTLFRAKAVHRLEPFSTGAGL
jgi:hypothetical protein